MVVEIIMLREARLRKKNITFSYIWTLDLKNKTNDMSVKQGN
jgi:hypothetical protein